MATQTLVSSEAARRFPQPSRIHLSILAALEKRCLVWMAKRTPAWINSDQLTLLGFLAQLMAGASYAAARSNRIWLALASGFLVLNWLGDSMDGTLARVRQKQRPRYGFYLDHLLDSIGAVVLMGGLAASTYMSARVAMALLVSFLLLSIQSYLATSVLGEFRMSFWSLGPTELRLVLILGNSALFRWPTVLVHYRLFDVGGAIGVLAMSAMLICFGARNTIRLYQQEPRR
jgi:archaetidylinositol phosphate synthase